MHYRILLLTAATALLKSSEASHVPGDLSFYEQFVNEEETAATQLVE